MEILKTDFYMPFYFMALVLSLLKYKWYFETDLKYFPVLVGYTFLSEVLGLLIRDNESIRVLLEDKYSYYNIIIFNIYYIIFFVYFFYIFWKILSESKYKRIVVIGALIFLLASLINLVMQNPMLMPQIYGLAMGSLVLITCIFLYFKVLRLKQPKEVRQGNLLFWICIGLLSFYPFYPIILFLGYIEYEVYVKFHLRFVHFILISVMYGFFIIGFIKTRRRLVL